MSDEEKTSAEPQTLKRYRVKLDGNRGEAVLKLTEDDAKAMGGRVLGEADSKQPSHGKPERGTAHADGTMEPPEEDEESNKSKTKAKNPANKSKTSSDK